jgi:hypothetical protein
MTDKKHATLDELVPTSLQDELRGFAVEMLAKMQDARDADGCAMEMVTLVLPRDMTEALIVTEMATAAAEVKLNALMGRSVTDSKKNAKAIEHSVNAGLLLMALQNYLERQKEEDGDV